MANNGVYYSGGQSGTGLNLTSGDVTRINISTGGTITFNNDYSFPTADGGANEVLVTDGAGNITFDTLSNASLDNSSITINNSSVSLGGSINVGTVTSVGITAGALIDVTNSPITTSGNITVAVDLSELTDMTATMTGTDEFVVLDSSAQRRKAANEIGLSIFNNDAGFTTNTGTVTNVTVGTGLDVSNGTTTPNITLDLSELTTSTSNADGDYFVVVDTSNTQRKLTKANIDLSGFNDDITLYESDGTLADNRTVLQATFNLDFQSASGEWGQFSHNNSTTVGTPRLRVQADDPYTDVLELQSSTAGVFLINGFDSVGAPIFSVDGLGNLIATSKSFLIKHPTKEDYALRYGSLEGPEHGVYVRGRLNGANTIELPDYWVELIDETTITVQLTSIGSHQNLYVKDIVDNTIVVANGNLLSSKINCFYFVQAERKDIEKMVVEFPRGTEPLQ